jgi:hypothetical protein
MSWEMRRELPYSLATAAWTGMVALIFVPLAWLKGDWSTNLLLLIVAVAGYLLCFFGMRIITVAEIANARQSLRQPDAIGTTTA